MNKIYIFLSITIILIASANTPSYAQKSQNIEQAVFAGGCFWCMEKPFDKIEGVISTTSGFSGGNVASPTYKQVSGGSTGHIEVLQVTYDPAIVSFERLLETYWANIDPLDSEGQFCDRGYTYKPAIFYNNASEKKSAQKSATQVDDILDKTTDVALLKFDAFYPAEDYHQDFYKTNSIKYKYYRWRCGRDARLEKLWGDRATDRVILF